MIETNASTTVRPRQRGAVYDLLRLNWAPLICLAAITWAAYYFKFRQLGLYEDDYYFIARSFNYHWRDLVELIGSNLRYWPQGRPIGFSLPPLVSFIGNHLGGLPGIYALAAAIVTGNALLAYAFFRRLGLGLGAIVGALAFLLYPADTTHGYLMHATGLQPSLTFLLLALLAYLSDRRWLAYGLIIGSLLTYETAFPVFLAAPLVARPWRRQLPGPLALHAAVLAAIMLMVVIIRWNLGDARLALSFGAVEVARRVLLSFVQGPWASGRMWVVAPVRALRKFNVELGGVILAVGGLSALWLRRAPPQPGPVARRAPLPLTQLALTGAAMWMLAYALAFTHFPPSSTMGRATSVHLAAALGASLTLATLAVGLLRLAQANWLRRSVLLGLAAYFGLLAGYGVMIQQDFAQAWRNQRAFWQQVLPLVPDLQLGSVVLVDMDGWPFTRYIESYNWETNIALGLIYALPPGWSGEAEPRAFMVWPNWPTGVRLEAGRLEWLPTSSLFTTWRALPQGQTILLELEDGRLVRRTGPLSLAGQTLELKPAPASETAPWPTGRLYELLNSPLDPH